MKLKPKGVLRAACGVTSIPVGRHHALPETPSFRTAAALADGAFRDAHPEMVSFCGACSCAGARQRRAVESIKPRRMLASELRFWHRIAGGRCQRSSRHCWRCFEYHGPARLRMGIICRRALFYGFFGLDHSWSAPTTAPGGECAGCACVGNHCRGRVFGVGV